MTTPLGPIYGREVFTIPGVNNDSQFRGSRSIRKKREIVVLKVTRK